MQRILALWVDYIRLAGAASRRTPVLTALIMLAVAVGIGASMSVLTLYRTMSRDPIPAKSAQLFVPQIEIRPLADRARPGELPDQLTFRDAQALLQLPMNVRQVAMYPFALVTTPSDPGLQPFRAEGRAANAAFFSMFDVPFQFGAPWDKEADEAAANLVVLSARFNDRIFGGENSVGRTVNLGNRDYRIVGVLQPWKLAPRIYDLVNRPFGDSEDVFMPLKTAIDGQVAQTGYTSCFQRSDPGWNAFVNSKCLWIQHWVELPTRDEQQKFRSLLQQYVLQQQRDGRFSWSDPPALTDARAWLKVKKLVSGEIRVLVLLGCGFLAVCLLNAGGLILAKFESRATEFGIRRALGATRGDVLSQCVLDAATIGVASGILGLLCAAAGLKLQSLLLPQEMKQLVYLDAGSLVLVVASALAASVVTAIYPAWRASRVQAAAALKAE